MRDDDTSACSVMFEQHDLLSDQDGEFGLRFLGDVARADVFLTIDIYDLDHPVHPDGHVGWWRFPVETLGERTTGRLQVRQDGIDVSLVGLASEDRWINEARLRPRRCVVNAVLRSKSANSIVSRAQIPAFADATDRSEFRSGFDRDWRSPRFAAPHYLPPAQAKVRIVAQSIRLRDAVGNLGLDVHRMLRQNGVFAEMYAEHFDLALNDVVRPLERLSLDAEKADDVLYFFSIFDRHLKDVLALPAARKIAYFHGITPPKLLQVFDPELSVACRKGLAQLPELACFDVLAANSAATAQELVRTFVGSEWRVEDVKVIAPLLARHRAYPEAKRPIGSADARLLYVGRLRSHKRIEHLLELFAAYRMLCPNAECWIVGAETDPAYRAYLGFVEETQLAIPAGRVRWLGGVSDTDLQTIYRSASVYVSMSEHEGFCLPVLEAMAAGLPVASYAQPAVQEVLGDSGITFFEKDYVRVAAHLRALLDAPDRLAEIVAHQEERAADVMRAADGRAFWQLLRPLLTAAAGA
jgi:glycosyltransferase involved in cell wall biosynthesis